MLIDRRRHSFVAGAAASLRDDLQPIEAAGCNFLNASYKLKNESLQSLQVGTGLNRIVVHNSPFREPSLVRMGARRVDLSNRAGAATEGRA